MAESFSVEAILSATDKNMTSTMKKALPMFERYFQLKAQALGYTDGLPWYELYAPIVESDMSYPF